MPTNSSIMPEPPPTSTAVEIAPGIRWIRIPLPFRLDHVNCWALDDRDAWAVIDCGIDTPELRAVWDRLAAEPLQGRPIRRLIATHGHTDHVGLAGYFVDRFETSFEITLIEWMAARLRRDDAASEPAPALARFFKLHGCDPDTIGSFEADRVRITSYLGEQPPAIVRIRDGQDLSIGGRKWRVICGEGHCDAHVSLYCAEANILIAGDQILPRITPVIGVGAGQPEADPLTAYLASLDRFRELDPGALVLPSHGLPFYGLHDRIDALVAHHDQRLDKLQAHMKQPMTTAQASSFLFARAVKEGQGRLALSETLAHLHRLVTLGRVNRYIADGTYLFAV